MTSPTLSPGTRLGAYEILGCLGEGGMGAVYRARDLRLGREVAIKVLLPAVAGDPDRLARFEREAKTLAALNHPNIAHIYGLEDAGAEVGPFLVMELVEGQTLAARIALGPILFDEVLPVAGQIAEALEAAHQHGIVHRDLKPANVKLRSDGTVKVLDFGLAKALEPNSHRLDASQSPTITTPAMTQAGAIIGTVAYMSPEQAAGKPVDNRSDIWSFGVMVFEMIAGRPVFSGETASHVLASVLRDDPDWTALPPNTPAPIRRLLRRCLERDVRRRLASASDALLEIADARLPSPASDAVTIVAPQSALKRIVPYAALAAAVVAVSVGIAIGRDSRAVRPAVSRFFVYPPEQGTFVVTGTFLASNPAANVVISPDGSRLAFTARDAAGKTSLWVRPLDALNAVSLAGTDEASFPFWSPDSRYLGYFAQRKLMKIAVAGGPAQALSVTAGARGGAWAPDGTILFSAGLGEPLSRVSSSGGSVEKVIALPGGQDSITFPSFLPDGRHFLFYASALSPDVSGVYVGALDTGLVTRLVAADSGAAYDANSGRLLFVRGGVLLAQALNLKTMTLTGELAPIAEHVEMSAPGMLAFSVSQTGVLAYGSGSGGAAGLQMAWFDRQGRRLETVGPPGNYRGLDLAPGGRFVAAHRHDTNGGDIWLTELTRNSTSRFTFDASQEQQSPVWSPDAQRIAYGAFRNGKAGIYTRLASKADTEVSLLESDVTVVPMSWASDGSSIVYEAVDQTTSNDLWVLPLSGDRKPYPLLHERYAETHGQLSPDGKWIAYYSNETGSTEVFVQAFSGGTGKTQVSVNGGSFPRWRADGRELFYLSQGSGGKMMAVAVTSSAGTLEVAAPIALFDSPYSNIFHTGVRAGAGPYHAFAVSADGQRFLIAQAIGDTSIPAPLVVVMNWAAALKS